jgi:hypothetical protein
MQITYIIVIILIIIIVFLLSKKNSENFLVGNEAIENITKMYANSTGSAAFNNIDVNNLKVNNIDISGTLTIKNKLNTSDIITSGSIDISSNAIIKGSLYKKENIARYVRVGNKLKSGIAHYDYWTIKEVEIYDSSGTNIAFNKPVTVTDGKTHHPNDNNWGLPGNITNGSAKDVDNDSYHGGTGTNELEIDLGKEYYISQIVIFNRYNGQAEHRANNTSIQLLDSNRNVNRVIFTGNWLQCYSKEYIL